MSASSFMGGGSSRTLTHGLLSKLFQGNSALSLLPYDNENGVVWAGLDFEGADEIFSIKDSFNISQEAPSETEVKIDQLDEVIDTVTEKGAWTFTLNVPTVCDEILEVFYSKAVTIGSTSPIKGQDGVSYIGNSYFMDPKSVYATVLVENKNSDMDIAFARVKMVAATVLDDTSNPMYIQLTCTILSNTESTGLQGDWQRGSKYTASL